MPAPAKNNPANRLPQKAIQQHREKLLQWYDQNKRNLPWRNTKDPYAILVSEFMLQQTQVATAIPFYNHFLQAFPTIQALAESDEQDVLRAWAGLGYYTRARNLRLTAQKITKEYAGKVPKNVSELLFLPGIGPYVAGAVASIAHQIPAPAVDANVTRVLCRLFAQKQKPTAPRTRAWLQELAASLVHPTRPGDYNQAIMELGARICTPTQPHCKACPLKKDCKALQKGNPTQYPQKTNRPTTTTIKEAVAIIRHQSAYLLTQKPDTQGRYRNMWQFPSTQIEKGEDPAQKLRHHLHQHHSITIQVHEEWAQITHQVTHHKITKHIYRCTGPTKPPTYSKESRTCWATPEDILQLPLGAPHKRILDLLNETEALFPSP